MTFYFQCHLVDISSSAYWGLVHLPTEDLSFKLSGQLHSITHCPRMCHYAASSLKLNINQLIATTTYK